MQYLSMWSYQWDISGNFVPISFVCKEYNCIKDYLIGLYQLALEITT